MSPRAAPAAAAELELLEQSLRLTQKRDADLIAGHAVALVVGLRGAGDPPAAADEDGVVRRALAGTAACGAVRRCGRHGGAAARDRGHCGARRHPRSRRRSGRCRALLVLANARINANDFRAALHRRAMPSRWPSAFDDHKLLVSALALTGELQIDGLDGGGWARLRAGMALEAPRPSRTPTCSPAGGSARACCGPTASRRRVRSWSQHERGPASFGGASGECRVVRSAGRAQCGAGPPTWLGPTQKESLRLREVTSNERSVARRRTRRSLVDAAAGDAEAALGHGHRVLAIAARTGDLLYSVRARQPLGLAELALGDARAALAHLGGSSSRSSGGRACSSLAGSRSGETLRRRSRSREKSPTPRLPPTDGESLGRRLGRSSILATAARARGLLAGRCDRIDDAIGHLRAAIDHHASDSCRSNERERSCARGRLPAREPTLAGSSSSRTPCGYSKAARRSRGPSVYARN